GREVRRGRAWGRRASGDRTVAERQAGHGLSNRPCVGDGEMANDLKPCLACVSAKDFAPRVRDPFPPFLSPLTGRNGGVTSFSALHFVFLECDGASSNEKNLFMARLKGKVAIVAGAGSIAPGWSNGKATAVLFAREGAKVFAVDRDLAAAQETQTIVAGEGGECIA